MKNFTKQNFKTNPLWVRLLIMAFMLLAGTSSAWGKTVYYVNSNNWSSSNVKVYYWGGDKSVSWPGSVMTFTGNYVDGYEIYSYDVGTSTSCIFSNNGGNQTSDLTVNDGQYYYNGWKIASNLNIHNCVKDKFSISNTDVIYYDNSTTKWANCYVYIGHHSYSKVFDMTLVSGTRYLWKGTTFGTWSDAKGWYVSSEKWDDLVGGKNGDCIVGKACFHTNSTYTQPYKTDPGNGIVYKGSGTSTYKTDEKDCSSTAYGWSSTKPAYSTTYTITLNIVGSGSVTIKNNAGTALFSNATANTSKTGVTYLTYLKNITATPSSGYALSSIKIGSTDYTSAYQSGSDTNNGYDLTGNVTITVTFEKACETPQASDFTYTAPANLDYNGQAKSATVVWKSGTGSGAITKYYKSSTGSYSTTAPTNVDTYTVAVKTVAGGNYCATNDYVEVGSFAIICLQPAATNFTYTAPANLVYNGQAKAATVTWKSGTGTGTITKYYKTGAGSYSTTAPTNIGTYTVAVKTAAGGNYCATNDYVEVGSFTITCLQPAASNFTYTAPSNLVYNGQAKSATVVWKSGTGSGAITKYYKSSTGSYSTTAPTNVGTYTVAVKTVAGGNYCATEDYVQVGTFTISGKDPVAADFSYTDSKNYTGSALSADVAWKSGTGTGAITTYYKVKNSNDNTYTTTAPSAAGTYTIAVTTVAGGNYAAATKKIVLGDFTINEVCNPIEGLYWEITDGEKDIYCPGDIVVVTLTYKGTSATAHTWGGEHGGISKAGGTITSGSKYQFTIYSSGNINLTLTDCDGRTATTETLEFNVHPSPATPTISFSANPVGQNKPTTLTVGEYNGTLNNYTLYKDGDSQGAYTTPQTITIGEDGQYKYHVVATSKACPSLTATSETVTLEVQEAGAKIVQLGDLVLYTNDNTDFVPMYVQKDGIVDIVGATEVKGYTWEYSANGTSGWTACSTGYVANGVGMENGKAKCNNWRANAVGYYRCKITYDNGYQYSNSLQVTQGTNNKTNKQHIGAQRNLPIISVNTGGESFPSDPANGYPSADAANMKAKISVDVKIFNSDGTLHYDRKARMNYRGSSSLNFKKKSYAFVTGKEKTKNDKGDVDTGKANLFGLSDGAEDKDWVLYAATPDPTMMRNRLTFDLYKQMRPNDWGVNSKYVELVINGEYMGVYVLMDKITANAKRVNITSGEGFIVKFDKTDIADRYVDGKQKDSDEKTFKTERTGRKGIGTYGTTVDQLFEIEYPEKEDTEDAGGNWTSVVETIKDRFEKFETALANKDYTAVRTLIDYDSWADWFILTEFIKNQDGFRASCIFVYNGGKIEARPLWDQELSFDNRTRKAHGSDSAEDLMIQSDGVYSDCFPAPFWFYGKNATFGSCSNDNGSSGSGTRYSGYLLADPCFVSLVKSKWATYQTGALSASNITKMVNDYATELGNAQTREESRWPYTEGVRGKTNNNNSIGYYGWEGDSNYFGYSASKGSITTWATNRSTPLGENTNGLGEALYKLEGDALIFTINPSTIETSPWQQNVITVNAPTGYEYEINFSALTNVGTEVKENGDSYTFKVPRPGAWETAGNGTAKSVQYTISATIDAEGENACGTQISNTATSVVTLKDVTENCSPEVKP